MLVWLAARLAYLLPSRPPGTGGRPPPSLEVRLDAVAAVLLDGLSGRRAGWAVGISKTEVGDSMNLRLGPLTVPPRHALVSRTSITNTQDSGPA